MSPQDHQYIVTTLFNAIHVPNTEESTDNNNKKKNEEPITQTALDILNRCWKLKPLYKYWNEVATELEEAVCEYNNYMLSTNHQRK